MRFACGRLFLTSMSRPSPFAGFELVVPSSTFRSCSGNVVSQESRSCHAVCEVFVAIVDVRVHTFTQQTMSSPPSGFSLRLSLFVGGTSLSFALLEDQLVMILRAATASSGRAHLGALVVASSRSTSSGACLTHSSLLVVFSSSHFACGRVPLHLGGDPRSTLFCVWLFDVETSLATPLKLRILTPSSS